MTHAERAVVDGLAQAIGVLPACRALGVSRASYYRHRTAPMKLAEKPPSTAAVTIATPMAKQPAIGDSMPSAESPAESAYETPCELPAESKLARSNAFTSATQSATPTNPATPVATPAATPSRKPVPWALSREERQEVLAVLCSERFADCAPPATFATLLDEGIYLCSVRTMYRILDEAFGGARDRRNQRQHPPYTKPEWLADGPNQLWSWDITKLKGAVKGVVYSLYVLLDVFSRFVVGWRVEERESDALADGLIAAACEQQDIEADGLLVIHADRGAPMTSLRVADLLANLGVVQSHSRPQVSNDNPYSESQFKTLKYHPTFPERFDSLAAARAFCQRFFEWYNFAHRHSGIAYLPPAVMHEGRADEVCAARQRTLDAAYQAHPERFVHGPPQAAKAPTEVWINKPPSPSPTPEPTTEITN